MPPEEIDSLNADSLKGLVLSLLAKIDDLISSSRTRLARIAELEGRAGKPPKTPTNSSLPPSSGQKANVADAAATKRSRKGHPGVARELCVNPDVTRDIYVERCACGAKLSASDQVLARPYDHVELPPIKPVTMRIDLHRADCRCCGNIIIAEPTNVHCQCVLPLTRADVSSLAITVLLRTVSWMVCAHSANGSAARASMLAIAPSEIFRPNRPSSTSAKRA